MIKICTDMNQMPPMTPLDYKVSSKELNMLKVLLPYVDIGFQPMLAAYIKYTELRATIDLFAMNPYVFGTRSSSPDFTDIISSVLPYLTPEEQESMEQMQNMFNTINMFNMFQGDMSPDMMDAFKDLDGFGDFNFSDNSEDSTYLT